LLCKLTNVNQLNFIVNCYQLLGKLTYRILVSPRYLIFVRGRHPIWEYN